MNTCAVILAGGIGSRLEILTAKRTKPAVPFAGKYRIIDFTLSNCVNSGIFDVMILAQYRPQSLIDHIGSGAPWDLNRDFTGGVRILTPYKARRPTDWYAGTADAVQQNFRFIKNTDPDLILVLSGDHVYKMDYAQMIRYHLSRGADLTIASKRVPKEQATRFGVLEADVIDRVTSFIEKPNKPGSNLVNMGVYLFNRSILDQVLWEDHKKRDSSHDFGRDIIPSLLEKRVSVFSYPFDAYWVDVGTIFTYWQAHMDLLCIPPRLDLNDRQWIIHTRSAERPPAWIAGGAIIENSMVSGGTVIETGTSIVRSVLSPGVKVMKGAVVRDSVILSDAVIERNSVVDHAIIEKRVHIHKNVRVGGAADRETSDLALVGKNSVLPSGLVVQPGSVIATDVIPDDYPSAIVSAGETIQTKREPYEI